MPVSSFKTTITRAFKNNIKPAIILQAFAISIVLMYYHWQGAREFFELVSTTKQQWGWWFSLVSTAIFGGLIPYLYLTWAKLIEHNSWKVGVFYLVFWAYKGVEVDAFYTFQAYLFGSDNNLSTIVVKTCVDQFIYSVFWAVPGITIAYLWLGAGFNFRLTRAQLNKKLFFFNIPTTIISNWLVWFPAVAIVYTMPVPLQVPMFNLVLCFFVMLLASLTKGHQD